MNSYNVSLPLVLEQRSNFDTHVLSHNNKLEFKYESEYQDVMYVISGINNTYKIHIKNIVAKNKSICVDIVKAFLKQVLQVTSLIIQSQHSNQHYSHLRLSYDITSVDIVRTNTLSQLSINKYNDTSYINVNETMELSEQVGITATIYINLDNVDNLLTILDKDRHFKFLLDCYYRAIASTDSITKYYNIFTAIEFIEKEFTKYIDTSLLLDKQELRNIIEKIESSDIINVNNRNRVIERVKGTLKNATLENRAEKLFTILNSRFNLNSIKNGVIQSDITNEVVTGYIKLRNSLYHGKSFNDKEKENLFKKGLELIAIIEKILINWK